MASVFSAIRAQMLTDAVITNIISAAVEGPIVATPTTYTGAYVEFIWGDNQPREIDVGSQKEAVRLLTISVYGKSREAVDLAIQRLSTRWDMQPYRAQLQALGVVDVLETADAPSFTVNQSGAEHWGSIQFDVTYRYTRA
jgi:hypothetical protein